jgi:hypothetical protein
MPSPSSTNTLIVSSTPTPTQVSTATPSQTATEVIPSPLETPSVTP